MGDAFTCDRCGEFSEGHAPVTLHVKRASMNAPYRPESDLCRRCRNELREWYVERGGS